LLKSNIDRLSDDAEVAESNVIRRYSQRPQSLKRVSLAEYVAYYDCTRSLEPDSDSNSDDKYPDEAEPVSRKQPNHKCRKWWSESHLFLKVQSVQMKRSSCYETDEVSGCSVSVSLMSTREQEYSVSIFFQVYIIHTY